MLVGFSVTPSSPAQEKVNCFNTISFHAHVIAIDALTIANNNARCFYAWLCVLRYSVKQSQSQSANEQPLRTMPGDTVCERVHTTGTVFTAHHDVLVQLPRQQHLAFHQLDQKLSPLRLRFDRSAGTYRCQLTRKNAQNSKPKPRHSWHNFC